MGTFNTYGRKSKKYGGAYPVWLTVRQKERAGGVIDPLPPVGTIIRAGTLIKVDGAGGKATIIETFEVKASEMDSGQKLTLRGLKQDNVLRDGMVLMRCKPDFNFVSNFGIAVEVSKVKYDEINQEYTCALEAGTDNTIEAGDILIRVYNDGGNTSIDIPTGITENDVWIEEGDEYATVASVFDGEIMEDRIQPIPECVKRVLPQIKFQKGI